MITAYQTDSKGKKVGEPSKFSDAVWEKMVASFGKKLRWVAEKKKEQSDSKKSAKSKS